MTMITHPALRGHDGHPVRHRRAFSVPGVATTSSWLLASVITVLTMMGLVMVMSASSVISVRESGAPWSYAHRQVLWTALGVVALMITVSISMDFWRRHAKIWLGVSVALLFAVIVPGVGISANGATRWLGYGPVQVQPSEFVKLALLVFIADLLARRMEHLDDWRWSVLPVVVYLGLVAGLVMIQPNLGTTMIIAAMVLTVLFCSGAPLRALAVVAVAGVAAAAMFVAFTPFRRARFFSFLDPWADPNGVGIQNVQSMVGMANGGVFGRGLGESTVKWGYLPYAWTDFIFAVIGEEFGLVGAITVVLLFVALAATGAWIAASAQDRFSTLVAIGITAWLSIQAFMNIGAVIGVMPVTGVPLPLSLIHI